MNEKMWLTAMRPLRRNPQDLNFKYCDIPAGARVETTSQKYDDLERVWAEIFYVTNLQVYRGWVEEEFLELYVSQERENIIGIRNATASESDAAQYLIYKGSVQYNLCGEFAVCYCMGWDYDLEEWLDHLAPRAPNLFNRIFHAGKSRGTTKTDLTVMLMAFEGAGTETDFYGATYDRTLKRVHLTPGRLQKLLVAYRIIASCHIETNRGRLQKNGVLHWVVLENVIPNRRGGWVEGYNPFTNSMELWDFETWKESAGVPYGLLVER